ncbi:MAG TPA: CHASE3 domain-containing protein [Dongiaceae bacterium]|nr:CHASE3 domain-containing protein [Dongiaceae bacterium]
MQKTRAASFASTGRFRLASLGIALLINVAIIGSAIYYQQQITTLSEWIVHTRGVARLLKDTQRLLIDAETGQRGYALTGRVEFTAPYESAIARMPEKIAALQDKTRDDPTQQANLANLTQIAKQELDLLGQWQDATKAGTTTPETNLHFAQSGKQLMDQSRDLFSTMIALEDNLYQLRVERISGAITHARIFLIAGAAVSIALIIAIFILMQREMMERRRNQESLSVTLTSIGDGVIATDKAGIITKFNRAAEQMTEWRADEAIGRPIDEVFKIINELTREPTAIPVAQVLATGKVVGLANHTILITRAGGELAIADSCAPIHGPTDAPLGAVLVFRDATDERKLDLALRSMNETLERRVSERTAALLESEERFAAFMDANPVIAWVKDERGRYKYMNRSCARIFGFQDTVWLDRSDFDLTSPEHAEAWCRNDRAVLANNQPIEALEEVTAPNGQVLTLQTVRFPFRSVDGDRCVGGAAIDITHQKRAETQLRQSQKMEAVGQLTGGIAHDFNNLLAVIIGNLDYVTEKLPANDLSRLPIDESLTAALRGAELTRQLLSFSRQRPLQAKLLDIAPLIEELSKLMRRSLGEAITIKMNIDDNLWAANTDPSMLESALMNLAVNARDAMPDGGSLLIQAENCPIDADYMTLNPEVPAGDYIRLSVSDTGTGMPPDVLARAFDPFFTTKPVGSGTGLGLSMVHGFAKQSGGTVTVYSEVGHGTRVNLYLPRAEPTEQAASEPAPAAFVIGTGETILVVEDNPAVLNLVERQLVELGYYVMTATDGPSALAILLADPQIDLLFTDVVMPGGMSGIDLAREARRHRPDLRVLYASGFPRDTGRQFDGKVSDQLLSKPYRRVDLAHKIREVLNA